MFVGPDISSLVDYLDRRQASLWHACQLNDLLSYFALGGVPARSLVIRPRALMDADDVAIALRSAGAHDFDRVGESLSTIEEVDLIYRYPTEAGFPRSADTRFGAELQAAFKASPIEAKAAEVSASIPQELISLDHVTMAMVEPLVVAEAELVEIVRRWPGSSAAPST